MDITQLLNVIDVSKWQGRINWAFVAKNVDAAMIKVGGSDDGFYMDGTAQYNVIQARQQGLPIGMYYFLGGFHAPQQEADHIIQTLNILGGLKKGEPFCLDWERRRAGHDEVGYLTAIVERLTSRGLPAPVIYMNAHYANTQDWSNLVTRNCPLWIASWGDNDAVAEPWEVPSSYEWSAWWMWQYSSTGNVAGINARVDLNKLRGSIDSFKNAGLQHDFNIPSDPAPVPVPTPPSGLNEYKVVRGDTLWSIAGRFGRQWQELYAINGDRISDPNRIFVGQKLRVWAVTKKDIGLDPEPSHTGVDPNKVVYRKYNVKPGDNLVKIAAKYDLQGGWQSIYNLNVAIIGANPNYILPGQVLRIPHK